MSKEGFAEFLTVLFEHAVPVVPMVETLKRPAPWEQKGEQDE